VGRDEGASGLKFDVAKGVRIISLFRHGRARKVPLFLGWNRFGVSAISAGVVPRAGPTNPTCGRITPLTTKPGAFASRTKRLIFRFAKQRALRAKPSIWHGINRVLVLYRMLAALSSVHLPSRGSSIAYSDTDLGNSGCESGCR
jgi:hypothetical protein